LQSICSKITDYNNHKMLELTEYIIDESRGDQERKENHEELEKEYKSMSNKQWLMIDMFNSIVDKGKDFAIEFINKNKWIIENWVYCN